MISTKRFQRLKLSSLKEVSGWAVLPAQEPTMPRPLTLSRVAKLSPESTPTPSAGTPWSLNSHPRNLPPSSDIDASSEWSALGACSLTEIRADQDKLTTVLLISKISKQTHNFKLSNMTFPLSVGYSQLFISHYIYILLQIFIFIQLII